MSGLVLRHAGLPRIAAFILSVAFSFLIVKARPMDTGLAISYFFVSELLYIGFIMAVLSENGLRHKFIRSWGEEEGYLNFEAVLGILFFHNASSMGYLASATSGQFVLSPDVRVMVVVAGVPFIAGLIIKILAAKAVSIDIYYWKDMFLGRKICDFVVSGPYKYFSNPMYGIGQVQAYAAALWYGSEYGLISAALNQGLVFTFYYLFEKKFIYRVYLAPAKP